MCWCNPSLRTPHCGKVSCKPPEVGFQGFSDLVKQQVVENRASQEAKNEVAISGLTDRIFRQIILSKEPDEIYSLLVELAHKSIDIVFKHK